MTPKRKLREEIAALRRVGQQFANVAYNLTQDGTRVSAPRDRRTLKDLQLQWDAIERAERRPR